MDDRHISNFRKDWKNFSIGSSFTPVLPDSDVEIQKNGKHVKKLIFCSGQIFYDLLEQRGSRQVTDVAIIRIEQLAPFPFSQVAEQVRNYPNAEYIWCQEGKEDQILFFESLNFQF